MKSDDFIIQKLDVKIFGWKQNTEIIKRANESKDQMREVKERRGIKYGDSMYSF